MRRALILLLIVVGLPTLGCAKKGAFDPVAAKVALKSAAAGASGCPAGNPGSATVTVTFAPSGDVTQSQVSGVLAGTATGTCIASAMSKASVPPFQGEPQQLQVKVTLR
jgi:hypothetical protein